VDQSDPITERPFLVIPALLAGDVVDALLEIEHALMIACAWLMLID
jgi:hypothetical protein